MQSFMRQAEMLRHLDIEPVFVFDGTPLPIKAATNLKRTQTRLSRVLLDTVKTGLQMNLCSSALDTITGDMVAVKKMTNVFSHVLETKRTLREVRHTDTNP